MTTPTRLLSIPGLVASALRGVPKVLCELLDGLATGSYDPHRAGDLKLLDLDRRINQLMRSTNKELGHQAEQAAREELNALAQLVEQTASDVPRLREHIAALESLSVP